jgi:hypothetical protein
LLIASRRAIICSRPSLVKKLDIFGFTCFVLKFWLFHAVQYMVGDLADIGY